MSQDCDYCGEEFGNAGALASHKNACPDRPQTSQGEYGPVDDEQPQQAQQPAEAGAAEGHPRGQGQGQPQQQNQRQQPQQQNQRQQPQQSQPPARQQAQQTAQTPAVPQEEQRQALQTGAQMGDVVAGVTSDDPAKKAQAQGKAAQAFGALVAEVGKKKAKQMWEQNQRAKNNAGRETTKSNEYPTCAECGAQITQMPDEQPFRCGNCGTFLEFK